MMLLKWHLKFKLQLSRATLSRSLTRYLALSFALRLAISFCWPQDEAISSSHKATKQKNNNGSSRYDTHKKKEFKL